MNALELAPLEADLAALRPVDQVEKAKVLVVDDEPNNLIAVSAILQDLDADLVLARSGQDALRCLLKEDFAVILMDVRMPGMDGLETAGLIRQRERCRHTPIIFLTAFEATEMQVFQGYTLGAVDYLFKPVVAHVLRSKVSAFVEMYHKTQEVKKQAAALRQIEQREHERQLSEMRARLEAERLHQQMLAARQIQQRLFPAVPLPQDGFDIAGASYPAEATGGDYFDYLRMRDGNLGVVIGDVSGHGYGPALLMAQMRAYLRAFLRIGNDLAEIIASLNRALASDGLDDRFATLLFARVSAAPRSLTYVSAGHAAGYILDPLGQVKSTLASTGMPLGIMAEADIAAAPDIALESGDVIVLITDGIVEAHSTDEELFGVPRLLEAVQQNITRPARDIVDGLFCAVNNFCGHISPGDDRTAIVIKVKPSE